MFKNWLIFTGIFIEMGVYEIYHIEYELNKINVFTKSDEEPTLTRNIHTVSFFVEKLKNSAILVSIFINSIF